MPQLNFHAQFADAVEAGTKRMTIRAVRVNPIKVGDPLYLFTGLRSPKARRLREVWKDVCSEASDIVIQTSQIGHHPLEPQTPVLRVKIAVSGRPLAAAEIEALAKADGFASLHPFAQWFHQQGQPANRSGTRRKFRGQLIRWA